MLSFGPFRGMPFLNHLPFFVTKAVALSTVREVRADRMTMKLAKAFFVSICMWVVISRSRCLVWFGAMAK